jgi:hypothetical protein
VPERVREAAGNAFEVCEYPVAPFIVKAAEGGTEKLTVVHRKTWSGSSKKPEGLGSFRAFPAWLSSRNRRFGGHLRPKALQELQLTRFDGDQSAEMDVRWF